jgi:hypothetical protein
MPRGFELVWRRQTCSARGLWQQATQAREYGRCHCPLRWDFSSPYPPGSSSEPLDSDRKWNSMWLFVSPSLSPRSDGETAPPLRPRSSGSTTDSLFFPLKNPSRQGFFMSGALRSIQCLHSVVIERCFLVVDFAKDAAGTRNSCLRYRALEVGGDALSARPQFMRPKHCGKTGFADMNMYSSLQSTRPTLGKELQCNPERPPRNRPRQSFPGSTLWPPLWIEYTRRRSYISLACEYKGPEAPQLRGRCRARQLCCSGLIYQPALPTHHCSRLP